MRNRRTTNSKENYDSKEENVLNKKKSSITRTIEFVKYAFILIAVLAGIISYLLLTRLGIGKPFQDNYNQNNPLLTPDKLDVIAYLPMPPGNLAVSSTNDIYFNFHPEYNPTETKIAKLINSTYWVAYPSQRFQSKIITCLSMRIDSMQRLWLLDFAQHGTKGTPALYSFDLNTTNNENDEPIISYKFPRNIAGFGSMLNDFQIDESCTYIYIIDTSIIAQTPALIVYDILKEKSYRLLSSNSNLYGDSSYLNVGDYSLRFGLFGFKVNADSIALSRDGKSLYIGAVTSNSLYLLLTDDIIKSLTDSSNRIDLILSSDEKPATDGLSSDNNGNIWMTAFEHSSIAIYNSNTNEIKNIVINEHLLRWPDGLSFGPDGLYISNSALHFKLGKGKNKHDLKQNFSDTYGPFHIVKIGYEHIKEIVGDIYPLSGQ